MKTTFNPGGAAVMVGEALGRLHAGGRGAGIWRFGAVASQSGIPPRDQGKLALSVPHIRLISDRAGVGVMPRVSRLGHLGWEVGAPLSMRDGSPWRYAGELEIGLATSLLRGRHVIGLQGVPTSDGVRGRRATGAVPDSVWTYMQKAGPFMRLKPIANRTLYYQLSAKGFALGALILDPEEPWWTQKPW